ncbi:hypothetical protein Tco_0729263 [Tanacetum coccineum]|uniref:Uncharacterized protein n=1 Tax=Tanacetum coccineum TaxID=301880 RepID=A0ABQ4YPB0_9ASTR
MAYNKRFLYGVFIDKSFEHVDSEDSTLHYVCLAFEEAKAAPTSPIYVPFVPEPVYPEFLPEDDVLPAEEQPLPVAASPTTESPGYIPKGEEHLAPADPTAVAYSADQDPYLAYRITARIHITDPSASNRSTSRKQRDALPSPVHETEMPEICLPLRKRPFFTTPGQYEVRGESAAGTCSRLTCHSYGGRPFIGIMLDKLRCRSRMPDCLGEDGVPESLVPLGTVDGCLRYRQQKQTVRDIGRFSDLLESRPSETETVSGGTKDSEEPQDSDDRASETAGTC